MESWQNNTIQFTRLLAEIYAVTDITSNINLQALSESMDLETDEIHTLFVRAINSFQKIKNAVYHKTELSPQHILHQAHIRAGWDTHTELDVLYDFISEKCNLAEFNEFVNLRLQSDENNSLSEA